MVSPLTQGYILQCRGHSANAANLYAQPCIPPLLLTSIEQEDSYHYSITPGTVVSATTTDVARSISYTALSQETAGVLSMPRITGSVVRCSVSFEGGSTGLAAVSTKGCLYQRIHHRMGHDAALHFSAASPDRPTLLRVLQEGH